MGTPPIWISYRSLEVKTNWSKYQNRVECLPEMSVNVTAHAMDRAIHRDGISRNTIQHIIDNAEDQILKVGPKSPVVIKTKDSINIVGELIQEAGEWVFEIITIMIKQNFVPKNSWDKVIYVTEEVKTDDFGTSPDDLDKLSQTSYGKKFVDLSTGQKDALLKSISSYKKVMKEEVQATLISIIDRIENQRIAKMNKLQEMKIGTKVKNGRKVGFIVEVSPKQTSIIVEFSDKTRKRFFMNKRKNHETLDNLSMHKAIKEVIE